SGNSFFNQPWVQAPASTESRDGLGPLFNSRSCAACHFRDGRGRPPLEPEEPFLGLLLRLSIDGQSEHDVDQPERDVDALGHGQPIAEPSYGLQLQPFSVADVPAEARPEVHYQEIHGTYADGEPYTLLDPTYTISDLSYGPMHEDLRLSPRVAPAVVGLGLLEAIDQVALLELEDSEDVDGDGISGRANWVWDVVQQTWSLGRFGWKAEQPTVRQQSAAAFSGDIGITTTLFPAEGCTEAQPECDSALSGGAPELSDRLLLRVEVYTRLLAVPMRIRANDPEVLRGKQLFHDAQCASCHVPSYVTGADSDLAEVQNQRIWPYTDLLLHDMGEGLSDHRSSFAASGSEWRTPPLWGLGYIEVVNDHNRLLHDGRARGVSEAILWHGGEAQGSKEFFESMPAEDREALVAFINSL
ncbi:MAG: di-heme oxidoredictase family protein, partial [Myxococcota bacterium]